MAVFFNGAFTRELRREVDRRVRRDAIEKVVAPHHFLRAGVSPTAPRSLFSGLGTRRLFSGRSKLSALRSAKSTATGTPRNQYSTSGNQSRSSVGRGRNSQTGRTTGTQGTGGTTATSRTNGTGGTSGTRPTNFQRPGASKPSRYSNPYRQSQRKRQTN